MKFAVHVYDRDIHMSVYYVRLCGSRCLLLTWCAIKGILLLFLIRTHKTSIKEETNNGNGLHQQKEPTELMVHALWLPDSLCTESWCFLTKDFDNRYDRVGSDQKQAPTETAELRAEALRQFHPLPKAPYSSVSQPLWDRGPVNSFFIIHRKQRPAIVYNGNTT